MKQHKKGDKIRYGAYGECEISDVREEQIGSKTREFFVLTQLSSSSTIFVPVEKENQFKPIKKALSLDEIKALSAAEKDIDWSTDDRLRDAEFQKIIDRDNLTDIAAMYLGILSRQKQLKSERKKLRNTDVNTMKACERALFEEFSRTVDLRIEDIPYIMTGEMEPVLK